MALNPMSVLMPKYDSVRYKAARLAFCRSKSIEDNPFLLPMWS
jgi:hypothetical protein